MGIKKGFLRLFVELIALLTAFTICFIFYQSFHNPLKTFFLLIALTIVLPFIAKGLFFGFKNKKKQQHLFLSRFFGCVLGLAWGIVAVFLTFTVIDLIPRSLPYAEEIHFMVEDSKAYEVYLQNYLFKEDPLVKKIKYAAQLMSDKDLTARLKDAKELQPVFNHKKIQAIARDKELIEAIKKKDLLKIIADPKIIDFMQDGYLMERFMEVDLESIINEQ